MTKTITGSALAVADDLYDLLWREASQGRLAALLCDSYVARAIVDTKQANYFAGEADGTLSFLPASRTGDAVARAENPMTSPLRQRAAVGKALRKAIRSEAFAEGPLVTAYDGRGVRLAKITDAEVEALALAIQANYRPIEPFVVTGEAIRYWYWEGSYTGDEDTSLHQSCMRYTANWGDTRFYAQNPRVCGLLCALAGDGKLAARALLWNGPTGVFMDRVYGSGRMARAFRQFADGRGWAYRVSDSTDETRPNKGGFFALPLQRCREGQKPAYLDTFSLALYHATGDLAARKERSGRIIERGDVDGAYEGDRTRNPVDYAAISIKYVEQPTDHPLSRTGRSGRDGASRRDRRVDWLSDFSRIPPWPADLLRTNPEWTLGPVGSDPEDDAANALVLPPRRTEALAIERPKATSVGFEGLDAESFRAHLAALEELFRDQRARANP